MSSSLVPLGLGNGWLDNSFQNLHDLRILIDIVPGISDAATSIARAFRNHFRVSRGLEKQSAILDLPRPSVQAWVEFYEKHYNALTWMSPREIVLFRGPLRINKQHKKCACILHVVSLESEPA